MTVSSDVGHAAVGYTAFNVRTDSVAYGTEVVLGFQTEVIAFDPLVASIGVRTGVFVFAIGRVHRHVIGQEVADRDARSAAVLVGIDAVVPGFAPECFPFDRALALCQSAERSSGNKRTNGQAQGVFQFHPLNPHLVIVKQSRKPGDNSAASLSELAYT